jgi:hypothetical protein
MRMLALPVRRPFFLVAVLLVAFLSSAAPVTALAQAQPTPEQPALPAKVITTTAVQQWQYRQVWVCSNTPTTEQDILSRIRDENGSLGNDGWEFVAFSPKINISGQGECFFSMYKRPVPQ